MTAQSGFLCFLIFYMFAWLPSSVAKYFSFGPRYLAGNRSKDPGELSKWGARSVRAHNNLKDYAPVFIGTVLLAFYLDFDQSTLAKVVWIYLIARLLHFGLYVAGIPMGRALAWGVSLGANIYLIIKLF